MYKQTYLHSTRGLNITDVAIGNQFNVFGNVDYNDSWLGIAKVNKHSDTSIWFEMLNATTNLKSTFRENKIKFFEAGIYRAITDEQKYNKEVDDFYSRLNWWEKDLDLNIKTAERDIDEAKKKFAESSYINIEYEIRWLAENTAVASTTWKFLTQIKDQYKAFPVTSIQDVINALEAIETYYKNMLIRSNISNDQGRYETIALQSILNSFGILNYISSLKNQNNKIKKVQEESK